MTVFTLGLCAEALYWLHKTQNTGFGRDSGDDLHSPVLQMGEVRLGEIQGRSLYLQVGEAGCESRQCDP